MFYLKWLAWAAVLVPVILIGVLVIGLLIRIPIYLFHWLMKKTPLGKHLPADAETTMVLLALLALIVGISYDIASPKNPSLPQPAIESPVAAPTSVPPPASGTTLQRTGSPSEATYQILLKITESQRDFYSNLCMIEALLLSGFIGVHFVQKNKKTD